MNTPLCCIILAALAAQAPARDERVDLATFRYGGMPTALASAPRMNFSAQKAADGKLGTGWVSGATAWPVWLRVEWRMNVGIDEIAFTQFARSPFKATGPIGRYTIESRTETGWAQIASGDASSRPLDARIMHKLPQPLVTDAIRLVVRSASAARVGVSEFEALGPRPVLPMDWAPQWQALWIWAPASLPIARREPLRCYLRRKFTIDDPSKLAAAWLAACAFDRLNALWVNNRPLLRDMSYSGGLMRRAKVKPVPLDWLAAGENVIAAEVNDLYEVGSQALLAELVLVAKDGTRTIVASDTDWRCNRYQGSVPLWRRPGFDDRKWPNAVVRAGANMRWHWLWDTLRPAIAPRDSLRVTALTFDPPRPKPGSVMRCTIAFDCARALSADYAIVVRLGQHSLVRNHDFELWGAALSPDEAQTGAWQAGRHKVAIALRVPRHAPRNMPATLLVSRPDAATQLEANIAGASADAYGLHFTVPVDRGPTPRQTLRDFPKTEVRMLAGTPTLHVDGKPTAPIIWTSSYGNYRRYHEYASTGVKLFRPLIEGSPIAAPGEQDAYYAFWLAQVDRMIEAAIAIDPDILVMPSVRMDPNPQALFDEPSEAMVSGRGRVVIPLRYDLPDVGQVRPTFMSQKWRRDGAQGLKRLVQHMRAQPYAHNVVGVIFRAGRAGENYWGGNELNVFRNEQGAYDCRTREQWDTGDFSTAARRTFRDFLIAKYGSDAALQRAWRRTDLRLDDVLEPARFRRNDICNLLTSVGVPPSAGSVRSPVEPGVGALPIDYYQCFAEAMIDSFAAWGRAVKDASDGRLIAGCYYGYAIAQLYTSLPGFHGHTAVARAMRTPDLDLYVSPSEYDQNRRAGGHYWGLNIVDSLRLHNKLWVYEQDTRTYLAECMPKTFSRGETLAVLQRDAAAALTRAAGWWYYEFANGQRGSRAREWFIDPQLQAFVAHVKRVYDYSLKLPDRGPSAEIAIFYHGETLAAQHLFPPTLPLNISIGRLTLVNGAERIGAPFDFYNLADIPVLAERGLLDQYKMCLFLNPFYLTAKERDWLEQCKGGGRTLVWLWAPGLAQQGEGLSAKRVAAVVGIDGVRLLQRAIEPTSRLVASGHALLAGLPAEMELSPRPYSKGSTWGRFGNAIAPIPYVDTRAAPADVHALAHWVIDGKLRPDMGAFCVRDRRDGRRGWASVYSPMPYLTPELMRNIARWAGVHIYRDANDILFANRHFVAIHTGAAPATGPLLLPKATPVYDVFARKVVAERAASIELNAPAFSTTLFYLGDPVAFRRAVEQ